MSFINFKEIKRRDRTQSIFIKTGLRKVDNKICGLEMGQVSIISGTNGTGKSTLLGQVALNAISQGYNVGMFSGEMSDWRVKTWITLQAAGSRYNMQQLDSSGAETNIYITTKTACEKIDDWLDDKLFVYDNNAGMAIEKVGLSVQELITQNKSVKLVIIDNLMALNIKSLSDQKYEAQKQLILKMCLLAKKMDVHILIVCHPTKVKDFIRKEDISGSSDIANAVDNIFIVHRNTTDFKKRTQDFFGWKANDEIYEYDNIIEIAKNREDGNIEKLYGFYFEPASKRFLNYKGENIKYGWESKQQSMEV